MGWSTTKKCIDKKKKSTTKESVIRIISLYTKEENKIDKIFNLPKQQYV